VCGVIHKNPIEIHDGMNYNLIIQFQRFAKAVTVYRVYTASRGKFSLWTFFLFSGLSYGPKQQDETGMFPVSSALFCSKRAEILFLRAFYIQPPLTQRPLSMLRASGPIIYTNDDSEVKQLRKRKNSKKKNRTLKTKSNINNQ
jgi:hypothetical protein